MADPVTLDGFHAAARVEPSVFALRPDYRAVLVAVDGLVPDASDGDGEALLRSARRPVTAISATDEGH